MSKGLYFPNVYSLNSTSEAMKSSQWVLSWTSHYHISDKPKNPLFGSSIILALTLQIWQGVLEVFNICISPHITLSYCGDCGVITASL